MQYAAETVGVLEKECDTIHGDLSVGNMVEFMGKILLIEWRTMRSKKQVICHLTCFLLRI